MPWGIFHGFGIWIGQRVLVNCSMNLGTEPRICFNYVPMRFGQWTKWIGQFIFCILLSNGTATTSRIVQLLGPRSYREPSDSLILEYRTMYRNVCFSSLMCRRVPEDSSSKPLRTKLFVRGWSPHLMTNKQVESPRDAPPTFGEPLRCDPRGTTPPGDAGSPGELGLCMCRFMSVALACSCLFFSGTFWCWLVELVGEFRVFLIARFL